MLVQELGQESGLAGTLGGHPYDRSDTSAVFGTMSEGNYNERNKLFRICMQMSIPKRLIFSINSGSEP